MKRILQVALIAAIAASLNSCGLPAALLRTAGSAVNGVGRLANGG